MRGTPQSDSRIHTDTSVSSSHLRSSMRSPRPSTAALTPPSAIGDHDFVEGAVAIDDRMLEAGEYMKDQSGKDEGCGEAVDPAQQGVRLRHRRDRARKGEAEHADRVARRP